MRTIDKIKQPIRARPPKIISRTPCAEELSALFNCWRAYSTTGDHPNCQNLLQKLMVCRTNLNKSSKPNTTKNPINSSATPTSTSPSPQFNVSLEYF